MTEPEPLLLDCSRGEGVVTLTLSGGERLELAPDALPADLPAAGQPIGSDLLARLRLAAQRKAIARRVFALLDRRLWTEARLRARLAADGFEPDAVAAVLAQFAAEGLVSDRRYADAYCRDTLARKTVGRLWLLARLEAQGVPAGVAAEAVGAALPAERERASAEAAARERWGRAGSGGSGPRGRETGGLRGRGAGPAAARARVARFLVSRGFAPALARLAAAATAPRRAASAVDSADAADVVDAADAADVADAADPADGADAATEDDA